jgi:hypothetical protein
MRNMQVWLVFGCSVASAACGFNSIAGSGKITTEPRTVSGFSAVSLSGTGQLVIEQTGVESLTITADDNLLPDIRSDVQGNTLELGPKAATGLSPTRDIVFHLTVKTLDGLTVSGSGRADAKGIKPDRLVIAISGSGSVAAQGTAGDLDVNVSGSGEYQGGSLASKRATINVSGSGGATVAASETLDANVSGSGTVEYLGDPRVTEHVSGSGSVRKR